MNGIQYRKERQTERVGEAKGRGTLKREGIKEASHIAGVVAF